MSGIPSSELDDACECTMSISTVRPCECAVSMRYLSSSDVPQREDAAKKLMMWYPRVAQARHAMAGVTAIRKEGSRAKLGRDRLMR